MTEEKYYLGQIHSKMGVPMKVLQPFFTKKHIADFVLEICNPILHCTSLEMQAATEIKSKWKRHLGDLNLASLKCAFLP